MIIYDLLFLIILTGIYLSLRNKTQINILWGAIGFLVADVSSSLIAKPLFDILQKNGWSRDAYVTALVYLVVLIITWGLVYALLTNISIILSGSWPKFIMLLSSVILTLSVAILACFLVSDFGIRTDSVTTCRLCLRIGNFYTPLDTKSSFVPSNLKEVYILSSDTQLIKRDDFEKQKILAMINADRAKESKQVLLEDAQLNNLAEMYGVLMVRSLRFSHIDANNNNPEERAKGLRLDYVYLGENLAVAPDIETAHQSLMASQSHRANILSNKFEKIGIACYLLSTGSYIVVEEFSN